MNILLFEDAAVDRLFPATAGRPAFAITCGGYRLYDLAATLSDGSAGAIAAIVRPHLAALVEADFPLVKPPQAFGKSTGVTLVINARLVPSMTALDRLSKLAAAGIPSIVRHGDAIAAAVLTAEHCSADLPMANGDLTEVLRRLPLPSWESDLLLFDYPHDLVRHHMALCRASFEHRVAAGAYSEVRDGVFVANGGKLGEHVATDTAAGPIVIEAGATVGPFCFLRGPVLLGEKCRVSEHSAIKDGVCIGHTTKIGGEIEASVIEPYTNKQHHGFVGHSYLGSWVNLGAGTCNSDLKNTYGTVKMDYGRERVDTQMQFVGAVIGDYAKTAINTGIFTGKTIGVCSMVYGFVTTNVPSFTNYARLFGQVTESPPDVLVATQGRMFARRNVPQRQCDIDLIHAMFELTQNERQMAGEPLSL
jgi:UDP-N-acetylglucosamine diphosphorylase / glucose-1-phosphate thymidylyltransferase / UDP-N-acetylgalactosamine diphosphorylase / glucosamine-1-phosphate N-acetyltransferase / galactosamine-1-phosphate N-acetyltransferase